MRSFSLAIRAALMWCVALLLPSCVDPYMPDVISSGKSFLVVDGFINSKGITTLNLSRTYDIDSKTAPPVETKATVYIEEEAGARYPVPESTVKGTYTSATLTLNAVRNYRLHILTSNGKEYASAYVPTKNTPPIDNISWRIGSTGLSIYVNSHDDTNSTQYYRWEYEETWEILPIYRPVYEYVNRNIRDIVVPYPVVCWSNQRSSQIQISRTTALNRDVVADFRIQNLPPTSERLRSRYSILVQQYALTQEEYQYWELLRKNTENIGTLFDPLPAQLTGNIACLNDEQELALGYMGVHSLEQKRIFISRQELPANINVLTGYESCVPVDTVYLYPRNVMPPPNPAEILQAAFGGPNYLPIDKYLSPELKLLGYTAKSRDCIDCRTRGTAVKPSFWP